jgi:hypothetical protein
LRQLSISPFSQHLKALALAKTKSSCLPQGKQEDPSFQPYSNIFFNFLRWNCFLENR